MREFRVCGWCLEEQSSWIATLGELVYLMCDPCLERLGDGIFTHITKARWAKEINCNGTGR